MNVGLHDDAQLLLIAGLEPLHEALERDALVGALLALVLLGLAALGDLEGLLRVLDRVERVARGGHVGEAEDLDRGRRAGLVDLLAVLVRHRADLAEARTREDEVTNLERAFLDEDARHRTTTAIEEGLEHDAAGGLLRIGLEVEDPGPEG